eukprot:73436_1
MATEKPQQDEIKTETKEETIVDTTVETIDSKEKENIIDLEEKKDSLNLPRVYISANKDHKIDIDNLELEVESTEDWKIYQRIGRGKYSEVFEGKNQST